MCPRFSFIAMLVFAGPRPCTKRSMSSIAATVDRSASLLPDPGTTA